MATHPLSHLSVFANAKSSAHTEAAKELITVTFISAVPFLIGVFAYILPGDTGENYGPRISAYFSSVFLQGQLFLISVSFLATSLHRLWNSDHSYRRPDIINIFAMILFAIIGLFYGFNPEFAKLKSSLSTIVSFLFFLLSIAFYYYTAVLAYEKPKSVEQALTKAAGKLGSKLRERRNQTEGEA